MDEVSRLILISHEKNLDQTKLRALADDTLKVIKMIVSVFHRVEKNVGKGEIACTISPFSTMFSKGFFPRSVKRCPCVGMGYYTSLKIRQEHYKLVPMFKPIPTQRHLLTPLGNKPFENTVGKGEIAPNEQFLLFQQCFLPVWMTFCHFREI